MEGGYLAEPKTAEWDTVDLSRFIQNYSRHIEFVSELIMLVADISGVKNWYIGLSDLGFKYIFKAVSFWNNSERQTVPVFKIWW